MRETALLCFIYFLSKTMIITLKAGCEQEFCFSFLKKTKACTSKCDEKFFGFMVNMRNLVIQCKIFVN